MNIDEKSLRNLHRDSMTHGVNVKRKGNANRIINKRTAKSSKRKQPYPVQELLSRGNNQRETISTSTGVRGKISSLYKRAMDINCNRTKVPIRPLNFEHPYRTANMKKCLNSSSHARHNSETPDNKKSMNTSFYKRSFCNKNESNAMKLINKAKDRDNSEQKYLAQSQKVVSNSITDHRNDEINDENYQIQAFNLRPFTTEGGQRQFFGTRQKELRGGTREMARKQKFKKFVIQNKTNQSSKEQLFQRRNLNQREKYNTERFASVENLANKGNKLK